MSSTVTTLTIALPNKIAVSIIHLNEVVRTLRSLDRQLDPSTTEANYLSIVEFRESLPALMEQMNAYMCDIETQYGEFHKGSGCTFFIRQ